MVKTFILFIFIILLLILIKNKNYELYQNSKSQKNIKEFVKNRKIKNLIVWGQKKNNHSHYYIHLSIYKAFKYLNDKYNLNCKVLWLSDSKISQEKINEISLIFSSPHYNTDEYLPVNNKNYYILHFDKFYVKKKNIPVLKYKNLKNLVKYKELRYKKNSQDYKKINNYTFYRDYDNTVIMPWATDLTKEEIEKNINNLDKKKDLNYNNQISFIGTKWFLNTKFFDEVEEYSKKINKKFKIYNNISDEENMKIVRNSYLAPTFQTGTQINDYIPCRIFKNISYGAIPVTNNPLIKDIFRNDIVVLKNYKDILNYKPNYSLSKQKKIMAEVKNYHTYEDRINTLITFFK